MSTRTGRTAARAAVLALLVGLVSWGARADADVRFTAQVDRNEVSLDDWVTLTVELEVAGGSVRDFRLPSAPDFAVRSQSQSEQSSFQFGPGGAQRRHTQIYTLILEPLREGVLRIEPGSVVVDGRTYRTEAIEVRVQGGTAHAPAPSAPQPTAGRRREDVFVDVQLDKERAHVGEEIVATVWLYARVDIAQVTSVELPDLDGFWVGEIANPTQLSARMQVLDGVPYRVYLLSRKALFPLRAGELEIGPAAVEVAMATHPFRTRTVRRTSSPLAVEVVPLPPIEENLPLGGVGSFRLESSLEPARAKVGDPVTFRLRVQGKGNLGSIAFPGLPEIDGLRAFEPTVTEKVDVSDGHYGGSKTQEVVLVPRREGVFEIPSLSWLVFDPATASYRRLRTEPHRLVVEGGEGVAAPAPAASHEGFAALREPMRLDAPTPLWRRPWFAGALAAPPLLLLAALVLPRLRRRGEAPSAEKKAILRELERARAEDEARWPEVVPRLLHRHLSACLGRETSGLPRRALETLLAEAGVTRQAIAELVGLLEACERERFAPAPLRSAERGVWERARACIEALDIGGAR